MLYKSLILGVLFGIGIFAAKSGVGLAYVISGRQRPRTTASVLLVFAMTYGLLFVLIALVLHRIDPVRHLTAIQGFLRSGMLVHMVMAGLMAVWGIVLLKRRRAEAATSRGWLLLVLPCPVCAGVILFSGAFLVSLFPDGRLWVLSGLYFAFLLISLLTMGGIHRFRRRARHFPEAFLGGTMLLMAAYFMLSVTVMPQFADLESVYRLARYQADTTPRDALGAILLALTAAAAFTLGCVCKLRRIRSST